MESEEFLERLYGPGIKKIEEQNIKKMKEVNSSSRSCILSIELINSLLLKFQYIFKLFFMMNIDKKKFN